MKDCKAYEVLLAGLMDNELTPEETTDVNQHLIRCAECREHYEQLQETSDKIKIVSFKEPEDEVLEKLWKNPYSRFTRNAGLFLVLGGYGALLAYWLYEFFRSGDGPAFPKIAVAALVIGFVILLLSVIRERMRTYKTDQYKEVER